MSNPDERHGEAPLLEVRDLTVEYSRRGRPSFRALHEIDLTIGTRETIGLVGESGAGKSTLGRAILGIAPVASGAIRFAGRDITNAPSRERRQLSRELQVVFQDPYSSLNPTRTIGQTLSETVGVHVRGSRGELEARVGTMLRRVGLPAEAASRFPGDFSGGQRQRIAIARALIVGPRLVICDEPVSALDLSVQAQVLNLLRELQEDLELSYLFVSHDLAVVKHVAHRIVVLYEGRVMEEGDAAALYSGPLHPYTQALLNAAPVPNPQEQTRRREARLAARIEASNSALPQRGCVFARRCPYASELCQTAEPDLRPARNGTRVACHHWQATADRYDPRPADHDSREPHSEWPASIGYDAGRRL